MSAVELEIDRPDRPAAVVWVKRLLVLVIWLGAIVAWQLYQSSNDLSTIETAQRFIDTVGRSGWGIVAYVLVYLARPIVLFPASLLTIVGGILFGPVLGVVVVVIAANASAMIAYGVGRLLGRAPGVADDQSGAEATSFARRWSNRMRENSFETVLIMRLLFLPYDLVNYASGVLRLRWLPFLLATALGSFPGTISFVLLGASLDQVDEGLGGINASVLVASVVIFVVSLLLARLLRRRQPGDPTSATAATPVLAPVSGADRTTDIDTHTDSDTDTDTEGSLP